MATPPPTTRTTLTASPDPAPAGPSHHAPQGPPPPAPPGSAHPTTGVAAQAPAPAPHSGPGERRPTTPHSRNARMRHVPLRVPLLLRVPPALRPLLVLGGVLLAVGLRGLAHQVRPVPYGDRLVHFARVERHPHAEAWASRAQGGAVVGYDTATGAPHWRYARVGHRPAVVLTVRGEVIALWDDGLLTDTDGRSVRWHRALPDAAEWLPARGGTGVLRPLGHGMLAVVAPPRVTAYRIADGDLRWVLPAGPGRAFTPDRTLLGNDLQGRGPNARA
ncbi:hypothetical protein AB0L75_13080 [Streptomyces sp. NPDC052101]|uniref:hypothetical protein n=1 Tax=Streptomyces sp. NPDC052101 TaxID=3155763 RepID=UPI0034217615